MIQLTKNRTHEILFSIPSMNFYLFFPVITVYEKMYLNRLFILRVNKTMTDVLSVYVCMYACNLKKNNKFASAIIEERAKEREVRQREKKCFYIYMPSF
jgi:hypothetical protein